MRRDWLLGWQHGSLWNVWEGCCLLWLYDQIPTYFSHPVPSCPLLPALQPTLAMLHSALGPLHMQSPFLKILIFQIFRKLYYGFDLPFPESIMALLSLKSRIQSSISHCTTKIYLVVLSHSPLIYYNSAFKKKKTFITLTFLNHSEQ